MLIPGKVMIQGNHLQRHVTMIIWRHGDPLPQLGKVVGVDSETELITDAKLDPLVVLLGVFDADSDTCYMIGWRDIPEFMRYLCECEVEQRYFNLGFDQQVLDNEDEAQYLLQATDTGRVRDMQIRVHLHQIATRGYIDGRLYTLAGCSKMLNGIVLDKGDPAALEESDRLTFRRFNEDGTDYVVTQSQYRYLTNDCVATWALGEKVQEQPTEVVHTRGMIVLAHISKNGLCVDTKVFDHLTAKLLAKRTIYRQQLLTYGFPDPDKDSSADLAEAVATLYSEYRKFCRRLGLVCDVWYGIDDTRDDQPNELILKKVNLRLALCYLHNYSNNKTALTKCASDLQIIMENDGHRYPKTTSKVYNEIMETYELLAFDTAGKSVVMLSLLGRTLKHYNEQLDAATAVYTEGFNFDAAIESASAWIDEHPEWLTADKPVGPRKFFQSHVANLMKFHPTLELNRTPKSGEIKLTLKDTWRLQDCGISDKFLDAYTNFNHTQNYLSTYMDMKYVKSDVRIHPRFTNVLRTGRTSCSSPNAQNLPSRDKEFPLRNMYLADEGMLLCATDYSFIELVCLAESCIQRFGFSIMGDIINAGVDPHRWFAGVRSRLITGDTSFTKSPQEVLAVNAFLKEQVTSKQRQDAKAANFGLPGGMGSKLFYCNCREQGIDITIEDAEEMHFLWLNTFTEMKYHKQPTEVHDTERVRNAYRFVDPETDEYEDMEEPTDKNGRKQLYRAVLINGMIRNNCSFSAALNVQFQGLAAYGIKRAMWHLAMYGYLPRLRNMVHDEIVYVLRPEELMTHIPNVERLMIEGMTEATPHVKVKVETCVMNHWDKGAVEFTKLRWTEDGRPIIEQPPVVAEAYSNSAISA